MQALCRSSAMIESVTREGRNGWCYSKYRLVHNLLIWSQLGYTCSDLLERRSVEVPMKTFVRVLLANDIPCTFLVIMHCVCHSTLTLLHADVRTRKRDTYQGRGSYWRARPRNVYSAIGMLYRSHILTFRGKILVLSISKPSLINLPTYQWWFYWASTLAVVHHPLLNKNILNHSKNYFKISAF